MRTNFQTWLNSLTNDDGSGTTGDLLNVSWFTDQMDVIGGDLDDIDADINALQNVGFLSGYDSVVYTYKDADTITIQAGGQFTVSDDSTMVKVAASTDLKLSTGRSTDCADEAANTLYYIWGGLTSLGATAFYFHTSATAMPSELTKGKRIRGAVRNDNSSNIMSFVMTQKCLMYDVDIACRGSDVTEVLDAPVSTSFVDVTCSAFIPEGVRAGHVCIATGYAGYVVIYQRIKGSSLSTGLEVGYTDYQWNMFTPNHILVNASGVFQVRQTQSATLCVSVAGYDL